MSLSSSELAEEEKRVAKELVEKQARQLAVDNRIQEESSSGSEYSDAFAEQLERQYEAEQGHTQVSFAADTQGDPASDGGVGGVDDYESIFGPIRPELQALNAFDLRDIVEIPNPTVVMVGSRRKGKSFWMRWVLYHMRELHPFATIFTETRYNGFWRKHFPDAHIHDRYDAALLADIIVRQQKHKENQLLWEDNGLVYPYNTNILIVFDDVMGVSSNTIEHDKSLLSVFTLGRHMNITLFLSLQDVKGIPPKHRNNMDLVAIFEQFQERNMDALAENYFSAYTENKRESRALIAHYTRVELEADGRTPKWKMGFIIVLGRDYVHPTDRLQWSIAEDPGPFIIGCADYWRSSQQQLENISMPLQPDELDYSAFVREA